METLGELVAASINKANEELDSKIDSLRQDTASIADALSDKIPDLKAVAGRINGQLMWLARGTGPDLSLLTKRWRASKDHRMTQYAPVRNTARTKRNVAYSECGGLALGGVLDCPDTAIRLRWRKYTACGIRHCGTAQRNSTNILSATATPPTRVNGAPDA